MHTLAPANAITVSQTADLWHLQRNGQTLAVIERAWDDHHWLLFLADGHGELVCQGAVGRIVTLDRQPESAQIRLEPGGFFLFTGSAAGRVERRTLALLGLQLDDFVLVAVDAREKEKKSRCGSSHCR